MNMKATSIRFPWIYRLVFGKQTMKTMSYEVEYRGPIVICAHDHHDDAAAVELDEWKPLLGKALAIAKLVDTRLMRDDQQDPFYAHTAFERGKFVWVYKDIKRIEQPFAVIDENGIFEIKVPKDIVVDL